MKANAAGIPLIGMALLLTANAIPAGSTTAGAVFLAVEAFAVRVQTIALLRKYSGG